MNAGLFSNKKKGLVIGRISLLIALALIALYAGITLAQSVSNTLPLHDYWSQVRQMPQELEGMTFRNFREDFLKAFGGWLFAGAILILGAHYFTFGPHGYPEPGKSPMMVRFTVGERTIHWIVTISFILLGISGLLLLYGKHVATPVMGKRVFASLADGLKLVHNFLGPVFLAAVFLLVVKWWRDAAVFERYDLEWFKKGGGYLGKSGTVPAGRFNGGQKVWFLAVVLLGLASGGSGLILDFSNLFSNQWGLETDIANKNLLRYVLMIHETATVFFVAGLCGHIYMAVFASPGSINGMLRGTVEENWAKENHNVWYEEQKRP